MVDGKLTLTSQWYHVDLVDVGCTLVVSQSTTDACGTEWHGVSHPPCAYVRSIQSTVWPRSDHAHRSCHSYHHRKWERMCDVTHTHTHTHTHSTLSLQFLMHAHTHSPSVLQLADCPSIDFTLPSSTYLSPPRALPLPPSLSCRPLITHACVSHLFFFAGGPATSKMSRQSGGQLGDYAELEGMFTVHETIGTGNYAKVKRAEHTLTKDWCAIKIVDKSRLSKRVSELHDPPSQSDFDLTSTTSSHPHRATTCEACFRGSCLCLGF
jgi:hypothetical protein